MSTPTVWRSGGESVVAGRIITGFAARPGVFSPEDDQIKTRPAVSKRVGLLARALSAQQDGQVVRHDQHADGSASDCESAYYSDEEDEEELPSSEGSLCSCLAQPLPISGLRTPTARAFYHARMQLLAQRAEQAQRAYAAAAAAQQQQCCPVAAKQAARTAAFAN